MISVRLASLTAADSDASTSRFSWYSVSCKALISLSAALTLSKSPFITA